MSKATGKVDKPRKRGLPKGRTNNPHGRPPHVDAVVQIGVRLNAEQYAKLKAIAERDGVGMAEVLRKLLGETL